MNKPSVFDTYAKNYNETHDHHMVGGLKHDQFRTQKLEWVSAFPAQSLLDFGCNAGELCFDLLRINPEIKITGVDEAQKSIAVAKEAAQKTKNPPVFFYQLNEIPPEQKFDLITVFNVLHHVNPAGREAILQGLKQRLTPHGKILIWEHNRWNPLTRYIVKMCPFDMGVTLVSLRWLKNALRAMGLKIQSVEYVNVIPPNLQKSIVFQWIEPLFKRVPLGVQYRVVVTL